MNRLVRLISVCSVVTIGVVAVPIVASAGGPSIEDATSAAEGKHAGARRMFERALEGLELRPSQWKALDELRMDADQRYAPVKSAKRGLMMALADQVEQGKIDRCELAPRVEWVASAKSKAHPGDRAALQRMHSILDKQQRGRFVGSLREQWRSYQQMMSAESVVERMDRELRLTEEQETKLRGIVSGLLEIADIAHAPARERWTRILDAFEGDDFALDEVAPMEQDLEEKYTRMLGGHLWAAEVVVPVLDEKQRGMLAEKMREKARDYGSEKEGVIGSSMNPAEE